MPSKHQLGWPLLLRESSERLQFKDTALSVLVNAFGIPAADAAEAMADGQCRYHSFNARLSVTRETLRQQYSHNVRRHPAWLQREELHKEVVAVLKEECAPFPGRHPNWPRYRGRVLEHDAESLAVDAGGRAGVELEILHRVLLRLRDSQEH